MAGRRGAGELGTRADSAALTLDKSLPLFGPEFLHLYTGFLLSTCYVLGTGTVCEHDRHSPCPQGLIF